MQAKITSPPKTLEALGTSPAKSATQTGFIIGSIIVMITLLSAGTFSIPMERRTAGIPI